MWTTQEGSFLNFESFAVTDVLVVVICHCLHHHLLHHTTVSALTVVFTVLSSCCFFLVLPLFPTYHPLVAPSRSCLFINK